MEGRESRSCEKKKKGQQLSESKRDGAKGAEGLFWSNPTRHHVVFERLTALKHWSFQETFDGPSGNILTRKQKQEAKDKCNPAFVNPHPQKRNHE